MQKPNILLILWSLIALFQNTLASGCRERPDLHNRCGAGGSSSRPWELPPPEPVVLAGTQPEPDSQTTEAITGINWGRIVSRFAQNAPADHPWTRPFPIRPTYGRYTWRLAVLNLIWRNGEPRDHFSIEIAADYTNTTDHFRDHYRRIVRSIDITYWVVHVDQPAVPLLPYGMSRDQAFAHYHWDDSMVVALASRLIYDFPPLPNGRQHKNIFLKWQARIEFHPGHP